MRKKQVITSNITENEKNDALATYATKSARIDEINASLDVDITALRESRATELAQLAKERDEAFNIVQTYATENKGEHFVKRKSLEFAHGVFGFRLGTPKLKLRKGFKWKDVTSLLTKYLPDYVRTESEPAKDRLLADRLIPDVSGKFDKIGVEVVQDEAFFIELKKETTP